MFSFEVDFDFVYMLLKWLNSVKEFRVKMEFSLKGDETPKMELRLHQIDGKLVVFFRGFSNLHHEKTLQGS